MPTTSIWNNQPVFVTGHTGFKGSWLTLWLQILGAKVTGYALTPPTTPSLFEVAQVAQGLEIDYRADLADLTQLQSALTEAQPSVIFHLAAQPLVRESYRDPLQTFATNVLGTANLLEAARAIDSVRAVVVVTTDKVYENREWLYPYREVDPLGGHDPYSASKAAAELVTSSYYRSFFADRCVGVATARAGNVVGGGDWASDRLVPDCLRAFEKGEPVTLRYPQAVRPWQHVLEPLSGYLLLAEKLLSEPTAYSQGWNFGPRAMDEATVGAVANLMCQLWGEGAEVNTSVLTQQPHEAGILKLDTAQARHQLGWYPRWSVRQALTATVEWQQAWRRGKAMDQICQEHIHRYVNTEPPNHRHLTAES